MSAPTPDEVVEAQRWLREAREELAAAQAMTTHDEVPGRIPCFLAHLAAEKAIKALLIARGVVLVRTHDLRELVAMAPPDSVGSLDEDDLSSLNLWSIKGRYPEDHPDVSPAMAATVLEAAKRVVGLVSHQVEEAVT
jgi:HEPN domain-containing protein